MMEEEIAEITDFPSLPKESPSDPVPPIQVEDKSPVTSKYQNQCHING